MRRFGFAGGLAVVTCAVLVGRGHAAPANSPEAVRVKRTHLKQVVEELSARDTSALTEAQRERRARVLGALRRYAERGVFPHNTELPRFALPYFIDAHGTRCAIASAIDRSGAPGLALALAARDNHVYVASLTEDRALKEWLEENGLTLAEAAYIQAPGIVDDPSDPGEPWSPPGGDLVPGHDTPSGGAAPTPAPTPGATTRTRPSGFDAGGWEFWWRYNRDAFVNLPEGEFNKMLRDAGPIGMASLDRPRFEHDDGHHAGGAETLQDTRQPNPLSNAMSRDFIREMLRGLSRTEQLIITLYYYEGMTMKEIGVTLDLSESRVSQMHASILRRIRAQHRGRYGTEEAA